MTVDVKVLTLNCWGVFTPLACQYRHERMDAIGQELSKAEYDVVLLQEIWTQADYEKLCQYILPNMPYTHYWHSGMFGTGCCIFSKHSILETFLFRFSLNGYAHKVHHGDWFGGKGIGLAKVLVKDVMINVYCTHTHAQYNDANDEYAAHRVSQGYEMGQFIKLTSATCDAVIVGGDFNFQPKELGFKLIKINGNLKDAWIDQRSPAEDSLEGSTNCRPDNELTERHWSQMYPCGIRIDYLLYRQNAGFDMSCEKCYLTMQKVPGQTYNYSDHEGVAAEFRIRKNVTAMAPSRDSAGLEQHLTEALPLLDDGYRRARAAQIFHFAVAFISLLFVVLSSGLEVPYGAGSVVAVFRGVVICFVAYSLWMGLVMVNREMCGLLNTRKDVNNLLKANPQM